MAIDNANFISEMDPTIPLNIDPRAEGAAQIRAAKYATQQSFPNVDAAVTATSAEMNNIFTNSAIHQGMVMMWAGEDIDIPDGWVKSDGTIYDLVGGGIYVTPALDGMFIKGTHEAIDGDPILIPPLPDQPAEIVGDTGGDNQPLLTGNIIVDEHVLTEDEIPAHTHTIGNDPGSSAVPGNHVRSESQVTGAATTNPTGGGLGHDHTAAIDDQYLNNQPTYYVLAYIIFVGIGATPQP